MVARLCALLVLARGLVAWYAFGWDYTPDTALYTVGGFGLFPSPLGRLVGVLGADALAIANSLGSAFCVLLAAAIAGRVGGSVVLASLTATLMPLGIWPMFNGVDGLGAAFLLAAVYAGIRGAGANRYWVTAVGFHSAAAFSALMGTRGARAKTVLVAGGLLVLVASPYKGILSAELMEFGSWVAGFYTVGLTVAMLLPAFVLSVGRPELRGPVFVLLGGGFIAAVLQADGVAGHANTRYMVPAGFLMCAGMGRR